VKETEGKIGLAWVSVRDRLPFDGHECALICSGPNSNDLKRAIGCRLHGTWKIQDYALANYDVRAWLRLPSLSSPIDPVILWSHDIQKRLSHSAQSPSVRDRSGDNQ
jgi:hypothetical protein